MADLGAARPILPQGSRSFTFANQTPADPGRDKQKNYVFVDEHNRHRRLKVMRACGACRRRKIKCDAATTNTWPCAACVKQSLQCVPPSSDNDNDGQDDDGQADFASYQPAEYGETAFAVTQYPQTGPPPTSQYGYAMPMPTDQNTAPANGWHLQPPGLYSQPSVAESYTTASTEHPPPSSTLSTFPGDVHDTKSETPDGELTDALQDLRIDQAGVAPYIANQRVLAEGPAVEENEAILPISIANNATVSIPPEMMPTDQQSSQYIEYFFANIHPYIPVINRSYFYQQWNRNKFSISPLILEGIFACAANNLQHFDQRNSWLALGARHEESFKDVPRLSTIQGLMLLLKARESVPKRGYYFRSWMQIQYLIAMAKDLDLGEHNLAHVRGEPCGAEDFDCAIKSRIWHSLFQYEMMIGGPQGRYEFRVDIDSVLTNPSQPFPGVDESELRIAQDQIQVVRIVKNIRQTAGLYASLRKKNTNLAEEPDMVRHNLDYYNWTEGLPRHLQITYSPDGSPPWIPFHFAANLHSYHLLGVILHHRSQLNMNGGYDQTWKQIMVTCYSSATRLCRLHEAILKRYGLTGLACMARGVNTAIYAILTCTMLHLVAITSPDPDLNGNAKDYFTRHMRVLEQCSTQWPMQSMQAQINSLREAFSADLTQPFELKASFPFSSPPPSDISSPQSHHDLSQHSDGNRWATYGSAPLTPPGTASTSISADYSNGYTADATPQGFTGVQSTQALDPTAQWDPSGVFDRWNTAFNPASLESPSPGMSAIQPVPGSAPAPTSGAVSYATYGGQPVAGMASQRFPMQMAQQGYLAPQQQQQQHPQDYVPQHTPPHTSQPQPQQPQQPFVTPSMWQDAVAKSYGDSLKRPWDDQQGADASYKRIR